MKPIKVEVFTKAPAKRVYQAWSDMYQSKTGGNFKEGYKGNIMEMGKKMPFEVRKVKKNESFTIVWRSFLAKIIFTYMVEKAHKGSTISCAIRFGGPFGWVGRIFLKNKMKKNLRQMLFSFAEQMDMMQKGQKIRTL